MCGCGPPVMDLGPQPLQVVKAASAAGLATVQAAGLGTVPAEMCGCSPPVPDLVPAVASHHGREAAGLATAAKRPDLRRSRAGGPQETRGLISPVWPFRRR